MNRTEHILVVDDHKMVCEGTAALVEKAGTSYKSLLAFSAELAFTILETKHIQAALVDARMPGTSGIELIAFIRKEYPRIKVIGMTSFEEDHTLKELLNANVHGILLKRNTDGLEIKHALKQVMSGLTYFTPEIEVRLKHLALVNKPLLKLTIREKEILTMICSGNSTKEIASVLGLSFSTVEGYRKLLLEKASVKNMPELVALAHRIGLV